MLTCKDCLHADVCVMSDLVCEDVATCEHFKDRSRFVELPPFKEGETLYSINYMDEIVEWTVVDIFLFSEDGAKTSIGIRIKDECIFINITPDDINKEFFLTAEAAKQALKGRENDE